MGKPTINQDFPAGHIIPRHGVYAARATVDDVIYAAVANVGTRPTVSEDVSHVNCETHILDFSGDLYGKEIKIEFCKFLRAEAKFDSVDALFAQINADAERAAEIFASHCGK
jgi:riboflavin kinase/FMN adenylyltransferase